MKPFLMYQGSGAVFLVPRSQHAIQRIDSVSRRLDFTSVVVNRHPFQRLPISIPDDSAMSGLLKARERNIEPRSFAVRHLDAVMLLFVVWVESNNSDFGVNPMQLVKTVVVALGFPVQRTQGGMLTVDAVQNSRPHGCTGDRSPSLGVADCSMSGYSPLQLDHAVAILVIGTDFEPRVVRIALARELTRLDSDDHEARRRSLEDERP